MQAAINNHYMWSAHYPVGGASELVIHMIPAIEGPGGRVLVRAPVSDILVNSSGKANGECCYTYPWFTIYTINKINHNLSLLV